MNLKLIAEKELEEEDRDNLVVLYDVAIVVQESTGELLSSFGTFVDPGGTDDGDDDTHYEAFFDRKLEEFYRNEWTP